MSLENPLSEVTLQMRLRGGGFVCSLARCMEVADDENRQTIIGAFPIIMQRYDALATVAAKEFAESVNRKCLDECGCKD